MRKNKKNYEYDYKEYYRKSYGKKIICEENGKIFMSLSEAGEYFGKSYVTIKNYIMENKKLEGVTLKFLDKKE